VSKKCKKCEGNAGREEQKLEKEQQRERWFRAREERQQERLRRIRWHEEIKHERE
jgi:hypothetical protein